MKILILYIVLLLSTTNINALTYETFYIPNTERYALILKGEIVKGDYDKLVKIIKIEKSLPTAINISSQGGSVDEAIKLGKFIRKSLLPVYAIDKCYSSCFYIWIASVRRNIYSNYIENIDDSDKRLYELETQKVIGLHRPYFEKNYYSSLSMNQAEKKYKELELLVRNYLKTMNVHEKWIDKMMMLSSEDIELVPYNIMSNEFGFSPPAYEEWIKAKCPLEHEVWVSGSVASVMLKTEPENRLSQERKNAYDMLMNNKQCIYEAITNSQNTVLNEVLNQ